MCRTYMPWEIPTGTWGKDACVKQYWLWAVHVWLEDHSWFPGLMKMVNHLEQNNLLWSHICPLDWSSSETERLSLLQKTLSAWSFCVLSQKLSCMRLRLGPRHWYTFALQLSGFFTCKKVIYNQTTEIEGFWLTPQSFQHSRLFISPLLYLKAQWKG